MDLSVEKSTLCDDQPGVSVKKQNNSPSSEQLSLHITAVVKTLSGQKGNSTASVRSLAHTLKQKAPYKAATPAKECGLLVALKMFSSITIIDNAITEFNTKYNPLSECLYFIVISHGINPEFQPSVL